MQQSPEGSDYRHVEKVSRKCQETGRPKSFIQSLTSELLNVTNHARSLAAGQHTASALPAKLQLHRLLSIYVVAAETFALEFSSSTTNDLNPAYVYVGGDPANPEKSARDICGKISLIFRHALKEKGWFYATGQ